MPHSAQRLWMHFVCVCFHVCGRQKLEYPKWSSMADDTITRGGIEVLGSFYICGIHSLGVASHFERTSNMCWCYCELEIVLTVHRIGHLYQYGPYGGYFVEIVLWKSNVTFCKNKFLALEFPLLITMLPATCRPYFLWIKWRPIYIAGEFVS